MSEKEILEVVKSFSGRLEELEASHYDLRDALAAGIVQLERIAKKKWVDKND